MTKKFTCSMDGCDEESDSGLFKVDANKGPYLIPLCERHFHDMVIMRQTGEKKMLMVIDYRKLLMIETLNYMRKNNAYNEKDKQYIDNIRKEIDKGQASPL